MVEDSVLFRFTSEFHRTLIKVIMIKIDVEVIRFEILVNGVEFSKRIIPNRSMSEVVEEELA